MTCGGLPTRFGRPGCGNQHVRLSVRQVQLNVIGKPVPMKGPGHLREPSPRAIEALFARRAFARSVNQISARHAATSAVGSACRIMKSAACCALLAAAKTARLPALGAGHPALEAV